MATTMTEMTIKTIDYPALTADSRQMQIIEQNLGGEPMRETDLVKVRTPLGGATQWVIETNGNEETTDELVGLLCGIGTREILWPYADPSESRPVVVSHDGLVGYRIGEDLGDLKEADLEKFRIGDGKYDWKAMTESKEFGRGSSRGGSSRCKVSKILALLRPGTTWPVLVTVGIGSLSDVTKQLRQLPCFRHEAVVALRLIKAKNAAGQPYSQIAMRLFGQLSPEQGAVAKRVYWEPIQAMFDAPPVVGYSAATENE